MLNGGNVVLQVPVGWLADRLPRRRVLFGLAAATAAGAVLLAIAVQQGSLVLFALLFV
ncbi:hypothetical protein [Bradyrhizobium japonicum]|uniref:hypothetical protein n=1 Tax=Bradyrhizobium japonicum TaxID=375 RepID=UPI00041A6AB1|nr:hypothetical protein [Bradyrhizobium japonicum]